MKRVEIYRGKKGRWFFRCVAANGECVGVSTESDGYPSESHARAGMSAAMDFWTQGQIEIVVVEGNPLPKATDTPAPGPT